jgi:DNA-binding transcriptional MerR regulator
MLPPLPSGIRIGELSRRLGVSQETLRAWERRYGVLRPRRTGGGYRVYDRDDVARARRMRELIEGGWAAAEAASAVATQPPSAVAARPPGVSEAPRDATLDLLAPLVRFDSAGAHAALDRILGERSLDSALRDVALPVMHQVGEGWARGELSVAQEHFATELVTGRLRGLARAPCSPARQASGTTSACCAAASRCIVAVGGSRTSVPIPPRTRSRARSTSSIRRWS